MMFKFKYVALLVAVALGVMLLGGVALAQGPVDDGGQWVDEDGDGVCDLCAENGIGRGYGRGGTGCAQCGTGGFVDEDGDGICDRFVDENGDGVCDLRVENGRAYGRGGAGGFIDENGDGICDNFVDENGDGLCDNCPDEDGDGVCDGRPDGGAQTRRGMRGGMRGAGRMMRSRTVTG